MCLCWVDDQTGTRDRALGTSGTLRTSGILGTSGIRGSRLGTPRTSGTFDGTLRMSAIACRDSSEKSIWSNPLLRFMRCASATSGTRESRSGTSGASYFCGFSNLSCSPRSSHLFNSSRSRSFRSFRSLWLPCMSGLLRCFLLFALSFAADRRPFRTATVLR